MRPRRNDVSKQRDRHELTITKLQISPARTLVATHSTTDGTIEVGRLRTVHTFSIPAGNPLSRKIKLSSLHLPAQKHKNIKIPIT